MVTYYSISISANGIGIIFNGYIKVNNGTITNFYYVNSSRQYVDILLVNNGGNSGQFGADNTFVNNVFSDAGTCILSSIPFLNIILNSPTKLAIWGPRNSCTISYSHAGLNDDTDWYNYTAYTYTSTLIGSLPGSPPISSANYVSNTTKYYSISISYPNVGVIFNGYIKISYGTCVSNFYYVDNSGIYVDILSVNNGGFIGDYGSDNIVINNWFTSGGTCFLPGIPFMNVAYNNPTKLVISSGGPTDFALSYSYAGLKDNGDWNDVGGFTSIFNQISSLPASPPISSANYVSNTATYYSISISANGVGLIFNGYIKVVYGIFICNFYYIDSSSQYVDILLTNNGGVIGDHGSDNKFQSNWFTSGGTCILPVIPYMNVVYNNPTKLEILGGNVNGFTLSYSSAFIRDDINWTDTTGYTSTVTQISSLPVSPPNSNINYADATKYYSISISVNNIGIIFNGYIKVDRYITITNFYYVNNGQYVDILLTNNGGVLGDHGSDNKFQSNWFTSGGTCILPVIPYMNTVYNNPTKLEILGGNVNGFTLSYSRALIGVNASWTDTTGYTSTVTQISSLPISPQNSNFNYADATKYYSISMSYPNVGVIFNGYIKVVYNMAITNFYYVNNGRYVDILLTNNGGVLGDNSSDNRFNNNFSSSGTNILPVIPYINVVCNNPTKIKIWYNGTNVRVNYSRAALGVNNLWSDSNLNLTSAVNLITNLPPILGSETFNVRSLYTIKTTKKVFNNNARVFYMPGTLSTSGDGSGVKNSRLKQRKT